MSIQQPESEVDPVLGQTLGDKYLVERVVADGGMGRVYEGKELANGRRVAIKILHADIARDAVNIERFRREAETSHALEHPHVVEVYDFAHAKVLNGRPEGAWYLVMDYLDGVELRAELEGKKTLSIPRAIRVISQASLALDTAHGKGFVHRDLKPDNLFLVRSPEGDQVRLLDFGSVKFTRGQDKGNKLTVMGTTIGSPYYMSPEQARGAEDLDHRADVWAVGAMLYEMIVGTVPFSAPNGPQILFKILGEEPMPPSFASDSVPEEIDDVVVRALAKDREKRFQSCGELADAFGHAFGLTGSHQQWASLSVASIEAQMAAAKSAPAVVQATPVMQAMAPHQPVAAGHVTDVMPTIAGASKRPSPVVLAIVAVVVIGLLMAAIYSAFS
ncbi:MAG: serine/threonine-protein kinase [Deltaproteobacteria bacterium]|nr:serine/threonine-protein kinase [Deltaproteobacteria bacterium]